MVANIRTALKSEPGTASRGDQRQGHHRREPEQPQGQPVVLQHVPVDLRDRRAARRLVHHLQHVLDRRRAAQPRARAAPRASVRASAQVLGIGARSRRCSSVSSRRRSGSSRGIVLAVGLKALLGALGFDIPASSIVDPGDRVHLVVRARHDRHRGGGDRTRAAGGRGSHRSRPCATRRIDHSSTSPRRAVFGIVDHADRRGVPVARAASATADCSTSVSAWASCSSASPCSGRSSPRPSAGALGIPIQKFKGVTGVIARENAMRNPKRTSATAAALMIGVALVGLITVFAASARTSVNAAIDRSMKADYVITSPGFGQGSIPLEAQRSLAAAARGHVGVGHPQRPGQDRRLGHAGHRRRPGQDRLAVRPGAQGGQDQRAQRERHRRARQHRQRQRLEAGPEGPDHVRADRHAAVHGRVDLHAVGLHELRDHHRRLREELHRPARLPGVREHEGWRHAREHRRGQEGDAPVPGAEGRDARRVQGHAGRADQPVPQPGLRAAVLRHRHRAVRHRQHAGSVDHRTPSRARLVARGRA